MKCDVCEAMGNEELIIMKNEKIVVLHSPHPFNNGHLIIAPTKHVSIEDMDQSLFIELLEVTRKFVEILRRVYNPHGFNIGIVLKPHVHVQLVPRWSGDVSFITLFYNVKVVPEDVRDSVSKIRDAVREYGA